MLNEHASDFFARSDQYTSRVFRLMSDGRLQQYIETRPDDLVLTVRILDYTKSIGMSAVFGPPELLAFGAKIDSVTNSSEWVKAPSR